MAGPASSAAANAGQDENTRPDDAPHAQARERHRPQHAMQPMLAGHLGQEHLEVFFGEEVFPTHAE